MKPSVYIETTIPSYLIPLGEALNYADEDCREEPGYIQGIQEIEKSILPVKEEFVMDDMEKLIERLMKHKRDHLPLPTAHAREGLAGGVLEAG